MTFRFQDNLMKTFATPLLVTSLMLSTPLTSQAASASGELAEPGAHHEQAVGLGLGTLVGALAAGPVGAIAGATLGSLIGWSEGLEEDLRQTQQQQRELQRDYTQAQEQIGHQAEALAEQRTNLQSCREQPLPIDYSPLLRHLDLDIHFATGSAQLADLYRPSIQQLGEQLQSYPQLDLELTGYADPRGTLDDNHHLAEARALAVRHLLVSAGVPETRIHTRIEGERGSVAAEQPQLYPLDRRVRLRFQLQL